LFYGSIVTEGRFGIEWILDTFENERVMGKRVVQRISLGKGNFGGGLNKFAETL
jgi:hypothetical protein